MNYRLPISKQNRHTRLVLKSHKKAIKLELADFNYSKDNVDCPLPKMQAVLKVITGLDLLKLERDLMLVAAGIRAIPLVFHNAKIAHHNKMIQNNREITGGAACYPKKCAKIILQVIKYVKSMHKDILSDEGSRTLLFFKEASATKGITIKRGNIRAMGRIDLMKRQKVHLKFVVGKYKIINNDQ